MLILIQNIICNVVDNLWLIREQRKNELKNVFLNKTSLKKNMDSAISFELSIMFQNQCQMETCNIYVF